MRIAINGFGRIGRALTRLLLHRSDLRIVAVNDPHVPGPQMSYLLRYDSIYGTLPLETAWKAGRLEAGSQNMRTLAESDPRSVSWRDLGVELLVHATASEIPYRDIDVPRLVLTRHYSSADQTLIYNANHAHFDPTRHRLLAASTCDANALAPILKRLHDELEITGGRILTLHPWLSNMNLLDAPLTSAHVAADEGGTFETGRAAPHSTIPRPTSTADAITLILPTLKGRLSAFSFRVPTPVVTCAWLGLSCVSSCSVSLVHDLLRGWANDLCQETVALNSERIVSIDVKDVPCVSLIDLRWTACPRPHEVSLVVWYDNERGYARNLLHLLSYVASHNHAKSCG